MRIFFDSKIDVLDGINTAVVERIAALKSIGIESTVRYANDVARWIGYNVECRAEVTSDIYYKIDSAPFTRYDQELMNQSRLTIFDIFFEASDIQDYWHKVNNADVYVGQSGFISQEIKKHIKKPVYTIPSSIDIDRYITVPREPMDFGNRFVFLTVTAHDYRKNIPFLVRAFEKAFQGKDDVCLVMKFSRSDQNTIDKIYDIKQYEKPRIYLYPSGIDKNKMVSLYKNANCFVTATMGEGLCLPILESMACDIPVIAPLHTAMLDYMTDDNSYPVKVDHSKKDPRDAYFGKGWGDGQMTGFVSVDMDDMIDKMRQVYDHRDWSKIAKAKEYVIENHSRQVIGNKVKRMIDENL